MNNNNNYVSAPTKDSIVLLLIFLILIQSCFCSQNLDLIKHKAEILATHLDERWTHHFQLGLVKVFKLTKIFRYFLDYQQK